MQIRNSTRSVKATHLRPLGYGGHVCRGIPCLVLLLAAGCVPSARQAVTTKPSPPTSKASAPVETAAAPVHVQQDAGGLTMTQYVPVADDVRVLRNVIDGSDALRGGFVVGSTSDSTSSGVRLEGNAVRDAENALRTVWEGEVGEDNVARGNCLEGFDGPAPEGVEVVEPDPDACDLDVKPLLRRAGVRDP